MTNLKLVLTSAVAILFLCSAGGVQAQTVNVFDNFRQQTVPSGNVLNNPDQSNPPANAPFQYGYSLSIGGTFNLYNRYTSNSGGGSDGISTGDQAYYQNGRSDGGFDASELRTIREFGNPTRSMNDELTLRPGREGMSSNPEINIVRFVALNAGTYNVSGYFAVPSMTSTDVMVGVLSSGSINNTSGQPLSGTLPSGMTTQLPFTFSVTLGVNGFVDFYTSFGTAFQSTDIAFLNATITQVTAVPETGTFLLVGISLIGAAAGIIKRRRDGAVLD